MSLGKTCAILLLFFCVISNIHTQAAEFVPKDIRLVNPATSFKAGSVQDIGLVRSDIKGRANLIFDYGVARVITDETITSYEIISTETSANTNQIKFPVTIPNTIPEYATSTYVIFLKSYAIHRPDTQNFFVTKPFVIERNDLPYIHIKNINLLQSNNTRAGLEDGPIIYNPDSAASEAQSINTSLEVSFQSDQETILKPVIKFNKLRSNAKLEDFTPAEISVRKGITNVTIPLPVFNYEPGVYFGELLLHNNLLPVKVEFIYIIAGETASVGLVTASPEGLFTFNIFGTPADIHNTTATTTKEIKTFKTTFMFRGKEVFATTSESIDFNAGSTTIALPKNVQSVDSVWVEVISNTTNKVLFADTKGISFSRDTEPNRWYLYYILILCIIIVCAFKQHKTKFIIALLLLCALIITQRVYGDMYKPDEFMTTNNEFSDRVSLYINQNIQPLIQTCGEPFSLLYGVYYTAAASAFNGNTAGFSVLSAGDADAKRTEAISGDKMYDINKSHDKWYHISNWFKYTSPTVLTTNKTLYITVDSNSGTARYKMPITIGECYACTNATSTSNIPNFQKFNRNYYYSTSTQQLYYRNISDGDRPSECKIDLCTNTEFSEEQYPETLTWSPLPATGSTDPDRYACVPAKVNCACDKRNMVCKNDTTGTSTITVNDTACKFQAFCTATENSINGGWVTFDAYNKLGKISYSQKGKGLPLVTETSTTSTSTPQNAAFDQNGGYMMIQIPVGGKIVTNTLTDSFDGSVSTASCKLIGNSTTTPAL
ncbi:MAG: hypothetical protein V4576_00495 [Patescibacteria group bacterium]